MKQTLLMPIRTKSENAYRRMHPIVRSRVTKRQSDEVRLFLLSQLEAPAPLSVGGPERFWVELCRVSAGELDEDNLRGALKTVRDTVAKWLGLDDRSSRVHWAYNQLFGPRGYHGVRLTVEDDAHEDCRETDRVVGPVPEFLSAQAPARARRPRARGRRGGAVGSVGAGGAERAGAALQAPPAARGAAELSCWALLPWEQKDGQAPVLAELRQLQGREPPDYIEVRVPAARSQYAVQGRVVAIGELRITQPVRLHRRRYRHPKLGGDCWVYMSERI